MPEDDAPRSSRPMDARKQELASARRVWSGPGVLGTSGVVIFLTYLSMPAFTVVPWHGPERATTTLAAERCFMMRLVDLADDRAWDGGIGNPRVRRMVRDLGRRHRAYSGMKGEYLDLMATVITLAPLRVRAVMKMPVPQEVRLSYWRYMRAAMALFGCPLPDGERAAEAGFDRYAAQHAEPSPRGAHLLGLMATTYPQYASSALPALFPACREVILQLTGSTYGHVDR